MTERVARLFSTSAAAAERLRRGTRRTHATDEQKPAPQQPDERDESAPAQQSAVRPPMRQAYDDLRRGQEDTDCRNRVAEVLPEFDEARKGQR